LGYKIIIMLNAQISIINDEHHIKSNNSLRLYVYDADNILTSNFIRFYHKHGDNNIIS
jgi:hypothetical protein